VKILVTGGAGFIGSHVVDRCVAAGHEVVVVDNLSFGKRENVHDSAKLYLTDIRSDSLREIFHRERPDVVNHHAAQISVPESVRNPLQDTEVNVLGLLNVLECCTSYGTKKVVFISSGGAIYGEPYSLPVKEDYTPKPLSPYAINKFVSEYFLEFYRHQHGLSYTVLRYSNVYGPRQLPHGEAGVVAIFIEKILRGELPTVYHYQDEPRGMTRDYCYVEDVAKANLLARDGTDGEAFNIGTGHDTVTQELYMNVLSVARERGYAHDLKFDTPHKELAREGDLRRSCLDVEKAGELLGWRPQTDLKTGLAQTFEWFLSLLDDQKKGARTFNS
jgi:UDP-glucose 4-epimerase